MTFATLTAITMTHCFRWGEQFITDGCAQAASLVNLWHKFIRAGEKRQRNCPGLVSRQAISERRSSGLGPQRLRAWSSFRHENVRVPRSMVRCLARPWPQPMQWLATWLRAGWFTTSRCPRHSATDRTECDAGEPGAGKRGSAIAGEHPANETNPVSCLGFVLFRLTVTLLKLRVKNSENR